MQFKQYPSYKNSGVEWLGDVPEDWEVIPSKFYFTERKEKAESSDKQLTASQKHGIIFQEDFMAENGRVMVVMKNPEILKKVRPNDFVISMRSFQGGLELSYLEGSISSAYVMLKPNLNVVDIEYFKYLFKTTRYIQSLQSTSNLIRDGQALRFNNFSQVKLVLPPKADQQKIVAFLDTETARIDTLIAKQEKLIELLEEQRKSIISHAVTKGLNPNAPMKDSGVEWLGEVPDDWNFSRLDAVSKIVRGNSAFSKMDLLESGKYVALQYGKTYKVNEINESFGSYVNQEFFKKSQITEFGDIILISTSETLEDLGHSCFYARHDVGLIGGEQFLLKPKNQNFGKYIYYATKAFSSYLQRYATGLKVFRFNLDDLKKIYIPDISLVEQQKIAEFLDKETARIDISVLKQKSLIEKLKEYRASIISHAVTGKIDVREFVA